MALHKEVLKKSLGFGAAAGLPPPGFLQPRSGGRHGNRGRRNYSPLPWSDFFDSCRDISVGADTFRVYEKGSVGPVILCLHGGGCSGLSWAVFSVAVSKLVECRIIAMDIRGHGNSTTAKDANLSADSLSRDVESVLESLYSGEDPPPIVLMGHSMGGAIAVHVAAKLTIPSLIGLAVIDVVEGTAMDSLGANHVYLSNRPASFHSIEQAIEWSVRSGQLRNAESARVSVPGQIRSTTSCTSASIPSKRLSSSEAREDRIEEELEDVTVKEEEKLSMKARESKNEEELKKEEKEVKEEEQQHPTKEEYVWRIDLAKTDPFWRGWFSGLTHLFLSTPIPKILILAGVDRLDKEMTIGHMQGKFQMQVLSGCGHAVHEDVPDKVAEIVAGYLVRHKFAEPKEQFKGSHPGLRP